MLARKLETLPVPLKKYYFKGVFILHDIICFLSGTASETLKVEHSGAGMNNKLKFASSQKKFKFFFSSFFLLSFHVFTSLQFPKDRR